MYIYIMYDEIVIVLVWFMRIIIIDVKLLFLFGICIIYDNLKYFE